MLLAVGTTQPRHVWVNAQALVERYFLCAILSESEFTEYLLT